MSNRNVIRSFLCALCASVLLHAAPAAAQDYTDIWWNSPAGSEDGWGVNIVQSDNFLFVTFFIYGPDKQPFWYVGTLTWDGTRYSGPLSRTQGSYYAAPWNPADHPPANVVGTASFTPTTASSGTLSYTVNGIGTIVKPIMRQTLTTIALGGRYVGGQSGSYSSCTTATDNGPYIDTYTSTVGQTAANFGSLVFEYDSNATCTLAGTLQQTGQLYRIDNATYRCTGSISVDTTATVYELKQTAQGIEGRFSARLSNGCTEDAAFSAVLR